MERGLLVQMMVQVGEELETQAPHLDILAHGHSALAGKITLPQYCPLQSPPHP